MLMTLKLNLNIETLYLFSFTIWTFPDTLIIQSFPFFPITNYSSQRLLRREHPRIKLTEIDMIPMET